MLLEDPHFRLSLLTQGFPGKSLYHGGLGWSTVALIQQRERTILVDCGSFNARHNIHAGLKQFGLAPSDITDLLLSHAHYDHAVNWVLFPKARIHIGKAEMDWAAAQEPGDHLIPELYIRALQKSPQLSLISGDGEFLPGIRAVCCAGHTPGSLVFVLTGEDHSVLFTGDAAKNRAELLSQRADMTMDETASRDSIDAILSLWHEHPKTLLVPGHDLPMVLESGAPRYVGSRNAGIKAWFKDDLESTKVFNLVLND